ncbi:MAG: TfoX/Sxy family protein [Weeksellaceae bacterium]|nr:TfoX/Sxy family protein [Weeksellaceae bacterium]
MASEQKFVDYILDQLSGVENIWTRKMFGEYALYSNEKIFALVCDNKLYIKPTIEGKKFAGDVEMAPPFPGAKDNILVEEKLDDAAWLCGLVNASLPELSAPKKRAKRKK